MPDPSAPNYLTGRVYKCPGRWHRKDRLWELETSHQEQDIHINSPPTVHNLGCQQDHRDEGWQDHRGRRVPIADGEEREFLQAGQRNQLISHRLISVIPININSFTSFYKLILLTWPNEGKSRTMSSRLSHHSRAFLHLDGRPTPEKKNLRRTIQPFSEQKIAGWASQEWSRHHL